MLTSGFRAAFNISSMAVEWCAELKTAVYVLLSNFAAGVITQDYTSGYIAWSNDSKRLAVGNLNYGVDVYELEARKLKLVSQLEGRDRNGLIKQIDFAQEGKVVVAGGDRGALYVWQLPEGIELRALSHGTSE